MASESAQLTTIKMLLNGEFSPNSPPNWPPDLFGVCGYFLRMYGGYTRVLESPWPPEKDWVSNVVNNGKTWSVAIKDHVKATYRRTSKQPKLDWRKVNTPEAVTAKWRSFCKYLQSLSKDSQVNEKDTEKQKTFFQDAIFLLAVADESWQYLRELANSKSDGLRSIGTILKLRSDVSLQLNSQLITVFPKQKSAQVGISERSLSNHLSFWTDLEILPKWIDVGLNRLDRVIDSQVRESNMYLMLLPWPEKIAGSQFSKVANQDIGITRGFGLFDYSPNEDRNEFMAKLVKLYESAKKITGRVDGLIFPELAMSASLFQDVLNFLSNDVSFLVSGVAEEGCNQVHTGLCVQEVFARQAMYVREIQSKHHRWKLNRNQLIQYDLADRLDIDTDWWENHRIGRREIKAFKVHDDFVFTTLICEDLARQDPAARFIRSIGPNLVIAVLMDGPQVANRWSGRYATVLADDPGCSVLSLSSIGMIERMKVPHGKGKSRSIAIWKDEISGTHEIELEENANGVLLEIRLDRTLQFTADQRPPVWRITPILRQIHQLHANSSVPAGH